LKLTKRFSERLDQTLAGVDQTPDSPISDSLDPNEAAIRLTFEHCADLIMRKFNVFHSLPCLAVYFDGDALGRRLPNRIN
jgi:spore germination protein